MKLYEIDMRHSLVPLRDENQVESKLGYCMRLHIRTRG